MSLTFSGWKAVEDGKVIHSNQEPKKGNAYKMFHGTHISNAKAIITNGFQRSKDGLLGPGVYVSRNIDKAKCYPLTVSNQERVVFKLVVRVGKVKKIDSNNHPLQKTWHQNGYDCAWVPPNSGISSIRTGREEDCVWDPSRITIVGVSFCEDPAKKAELRKLIHRHRLGAFGCPECGQDASDGPHPVQSCWQCGKNICPFQYKHYCKK